MIAGWKRVLGLGAMASTFVVVAGAPAACGGKKGGLMLAVNTDMKAPKDVNVISLSVLVNNQVKVNYQGRVTPDGKVLLPATVALTEPEDPNASIRIRVVAFQERRARVLRDVRTTIPRDGRVALLRVPLNFVNDGSGGGELPIGTLLSDDDVPIGSGPGANGGSSSGAASSTSGGASSGGSSSGASSGGASSGGTSSGGASSGGSAFGAGEFNPYEVVTSSCPLDQTIIEGECRDDFIDSSTLPDFDERAVGKGDDRGVCFDIKQCFASATDIGASAGAGAGGGGSGEVDRDAGGAKDQDFRPRAVTLDKANCTLQLNGEDPNQLNLALVTPDTGECIRPNDCYIPIDRGDGGWREENGQIKLPTFVCTLLTSKGLRLQHSTSCAAKKAENPICAETTPTPGGGLDGGGGGADGSVVGLPAGAQRIIDEPFATTVRLVEDQLYFAGAGRAGRSPLVDPNPVPLPSVVTLPGAPPGQQPWAFSMPFPGGVGLTSTMSPVGFLLNGGSSSATAVSVAPQVNSVAETQGNHIWGVGLTSGGVYEGSTGTATRVPWSPTVDVTFLLGGPAGFLLGDSQGNMSACSFTTTACTAPALFSGRRIDGVAIDPMAPTFGFVLTSNFITRAELAPQDLVIKVLQSTPTQTSGLSLESYFRRGIATHPAAPGCVFFTSAQGVEFAKNDLSTSGVIVPVTPQAPALGIDVGQSGPDVRSLQTYVYYTLFSDSANGGGVWRVPVPTECLQP